MSLRDKQKGREKMLTYKKVQLAPGGEKCCWLKRNCTCWRHSGNHAHLAAGQVQGSVPVLIQQCQISLGPVKEDGCKTQRGSISATTDCSWRHQTTDLCSNQSKMRRITNPQCRCAPCQRRSSELSAHCCPPRWSLPRGEAPAEGLQHPPQMQQHVVGSCRYTENLNRWLDHQS